MEDSSDSISYLLQAEAVVEVEEAAEEALAIEVAEAALVEEVASVLVAFSVKVVNSV